MAGSSVVPKARPRPDHDFARALSDAVLQHIRTGEYFYTLEPGPYGTTGNDAIDEFWLDRKLGFCEHFASAYVVVMRAMGVPARVVKYRFPKDVIEQLQAIAWWDWDRATLVERFNELLDLESFIAKYGASPVPRSEQPLPASLAE